MVFSGIQAIISRCAEVVEELVHVPQEVVSKVSKTFQKTTMNDEPILDCAAAKKNIASYQDKITTFDAFITSRSDLKTCTAKHLKKFSRLFKDAKIGSYEPVSSNEQLEEWAKLKRTEIDLEFLWKQRKMFVGMYPDVRALMIKHVENMLKAENISEIDKKALLLIPEFE